MAKQAFRNHNGLRDSNRPIKNGLSARVEAQVLQLNGASYAKLANSADQGNPDLRVPVSAAPITFDAPKTPEQLASEAETKRLLEAAGGGNPTPTAADKAAAEAKAKKNPTTATPTVALANAKKPFPDFIKKKIDAAKGKDDEDDVPAKGKKVKNSIYPSIRGNYQSALSAIRTKLANADFEFLDDEDDEDDAPNSDLIGKRPIAGKEIIYGPNNEDLDGTPASKLVVTTQDPTVQ